MSYGLRLRLFSWSFETYLNKTTIGPRYEKKLKRTKLWKLNFEDVYVSTRVVFLNNWPVTVSFLNKDKECFQEKLDIFSFFLSLFLSFICLRILCPADDTRNQIFKVPIKGSLFHINRNFGSTAGDILVFVYSRCWKTCLTFLNMFLSLMEDIDIKQIESFFEGFLKYT